MAGSSWENKPVGHCSNSLQTLHKQVWFTRMGGGHTHNRKNPQPTTKKSALICTLPYSTQHCSSSPTCPFNPHPSMSPGLAPLMVRSIVTAQALAQPTQRSFGSWASWPELSSKTFVLCTWEDSVSILGSGWWGGGVEKKKLYSIRSHWD